MAKLSKPETKLHNEAERLIADAEQTGTPLTHDQRRFILDHWLPAANYNVGAAGIFFTPGGIAQEAMLHTDERARRVLDLCAGIGRLAYERLQYYEYIDQTPEMVCLEINPEFARIGKLVVPEAQWVCASVLDLPTIDSLGRFDEVISNPPFGVIPKSVKATGLKYNAGLLQYAVAQVAMRVADQGMFILPQGDLPFRYSGRNEYQEVKNDRYERFSQENGIEFSMNCGIDTTALEDNAFHGTSIIVEIVGVEKLPGEQRLLF